MATEIIDIKDVTTRADVNKLFLQQCTNHGLEVSFGSYIFGLLAIPIALKNFHKRIPISNEYKLAIGALSIMTISYFAGTYAKRRCEENLKKQLQELNIEHYR